MITILWRSELLKGESEGLLKLPTDKVLVEDPEFRQYVERYAKVPKYSVPFLLKQNSLFSCDLEISI